MSELTTYTGGCHCGAVRFQIKLPQKKAIECNCSICHMKGFINVIVTKEQFQLDQGEEALATYTFNTHTAKHRFCSRCGIHVFTRPRSHPDGFDVNGRCLDAGLDGFDIQPFDGQNWEESVASIQ